MEREREREERERERDGEGEGERGEYHVATERLESAGAHCW